MSDPGLAGKVAIITGGATGLGAVYAHALLDAGCLVAIIDMDAHALTAFLDESADAADRILTWQADAAHDGMAETVVADVIDQVGGVDILINNAGLARGPYLAHLELGDADWRRLLAVNVVAPVSWARACRATMRERGNGVVINQSSMAAFSLLHSAYAVSKSALNAVTVAMAAELGPEGIRVNAIAPGMMNGRVSAETIARVEGLQALKQRGRPDDLIGTLLYLCSGASSFVTGQILSVDGGIRRA